MIDLKQVAEQMLAQHGLAVLPCTQNEKHPGKALPSFKEYTSERIGEIPGLYVAIKNLTGGFLWCEGLPPGYVIVDADFPEEYWAEFCEMIGVELSEVETQVRTASDRLHLYLKLPDGVQLVDSKQIEFRDGTEHNVDLRGAFSRKGIMLPGSQAFSKALGKVGEYRADPAAAQRIFSLDWHEVSADAADQILELFGSSASSYEPGAQPSSAAEAFGKRVNHLLEKVLGGNEVRNTNELAYWLGEDFGASVKTQVAADFLIHDAWFQMLANCPKEIRDAFERRSGDGHRKSFERGAKESIAISQRLVANQIAMAINPRLVDSADPFDAQVVARFRGAVGARLTADGGILFGLLPLEHHSDARVRLAPDDWDHAMCKKVELDQGFSQVKGISWLTRVLVRLKLDQKFESAFKKGLEEWLSCGLVPDESSGEAVLNQLRDRIKVFVPAEFLAEKEALNESAAKKWLWHVAPISGGKRRSPFVALLPGGQKVIAVPSSAHLPVEAMEVITGGVQPLAEYAGSHAGAKVHCYPIPEQLLPEVENAA